MATPVIHAQATVNRYGGRIEDYVAIHKWFDFTKSYHPDFRHRALRHHSLGVEECVERFGDYIINSNNKKVPVKTIGEQHIMEDCGYIPSVSDWLINLQPKRFMMDAKKLERKVA